MEPEKRPMPEAETSERSPPPYPGPPTRAVPMGSTSVTVITSPGVIVPIHTVTVMGTKPSSYVCKSCHAEITTRTESKVTTKTHIFALVMCLFGLWCCACLPYCMDSCQNVDHYCPNCNAYVGSSRS